MLEITTYEMNAYFVLCSILSEITLNTADPCSSYSIIDQENDATRSVANSAQSTLCDNILNSAWYRVTSKAGERMPTQCILGGLRCGTSSPIWLNGSYPSKNEVVHATACASRFDGTCCAYSYAIQIKNCSDYLVYHLLPTNPCYQAYCFGTELPCPKGQTSTNGFSPNCVGSMAVSTENVSNTATLSSTDSPLSNSGVSHIQTSTSTVLNHQNKSEGNGLPQYIFVIIGILSLGLLVLSLVIIILFRTRRRKSDNKTDVNASIQNNEGYTESPSYDTVMTSHDDSHYYTGLKKEPENPSQYDSIDYSSDEFIRGDVNVSEPKTNVSRNQYADTTITP